MGGGPHLNADQSLEVKEGAPRGQEETGTSSLPALKACDCEASRFYGPIAFKSYDLSLAVLRSCQLGSLK